MSTRLLLVSFVLMAAASAQALRSVDLPAMSLRSAVFDPARGSVLYLGNDSLREWTGGHWRRLPIGSPTMRVPKMFAMPAQHRLLAVAQSEYSYATETWVCDMVRWTQLPQAAAPSWPQGQIAYDTARDEVVAFGGLGGALTGYLNETWVFDGANWIQRQPANSPPAGTPGAMAYDSVRQRTVLVTGGSSGASETWEWDGSNWTNVATPVAPPKRTYGGMAFDTARARMILVGGAQFTTLADCWEYDGTTWQQRAPLPAAARMWHSLVYDPVLARTLLIGGNDGVFDVQDVWSWDGNAWTQAPDFGSAPRAAVGAAVAVETGGASVLLYGGASNQRWPTHLGETWRWNGSTWTQLTGNAPPLIPTPSLAPGVQGALMWSQLGVTHLLFGYVYEQTGYSVPVYYWPHAMSTFDGTNWSPAGLAVTPPVRRGSAVAVDSQQGEALLFGGEGPVPTGGFTLLDDTWVFDGASWQLRAPATHPTARVGHTMAYDPQRDRVVLFGGYDGSGPLTDTWEWDGANWMQVATANQPPQGSMAHDPAGQRVVLFVNPYSLGGQQLPSTIARAWTYDGMDWSPLPIDPAGAVLPGQALGGFGGGLLVVSDSRLQRYHPDSSELEVIGTPCTSDAARLSADRWPDLGATGFTLQLTHGTPLSFAGMAGSTTQVSAPVLSCMLHVDPTQALVALTTDARGAAEVALPVPNTPTLLGAELFFQAATPSALGAAGLSLSAALRIRIGR